jgi:hypothetical protein
MYLLYVIDFDVLKGCGSCRLFVVSVQPLDEPLCSVVQSTIKQKQ